MIMSRTRVMIDQHLDAAGNMMSFESVELGIGKQEKVVSAADGVTMVDPVDNIVFLNANPAKIIGSGYDLPTSLLPNIPGATKWHALVLSCNHPDAPPQLQALKLTIPKDLP